MSALTISLTDGFDHDHVVVTVGSTVVLDDTEVTTRPQISLAEQVTVPAPAEHTTVQVELPARGLVDSIQVRPSATPAILVRVHAGRLDLDATDLPRHA